ncbi:putative uncharacterized protein [Parachlamydia acanthamoebae UV-7]|uniref:Uncharacterized protein n=2 Tax=Parachlamydia acanthamoebae TaxID=83552 RepID=F8L0N6_PARAV|nr:putative uncharacterized protein [Parachlamydia acanthamoebae UV-7]
MHTPTLLGLKMKNIFGVIIALVLIAISLLAAFSLWEKSPNEKLKVEDEDDHHHNHHHHHAHGDHEHDHDDFITFSNEQIFSGNISLEEASFGTLKEMITASGRIRMHPDKIAYIVPKVSGIVVEAKKNVGDTVAANEILAVLESREMAEAKAVFLAALKRERLKNRVFQQEKELYEKKLSSEQDFLQAEANFEESVIDLELAKQHLLALGIRENEVNQLDKDTRPLRYYMLRAPFAGTVVHRHLTPGELIETTHEAYQIADLSTYWVELDIPATDFYKVKVGHPIVLQTCEGRESPAEISYVSPLLNEENRKGTAVALISQDALNSPAGTFVFAQIETGCCSPPLVIPKEAVQKMEGMQVIFIKETAGFHIRPVEVGRQDNKQIEIISGLSAGEIFAVKNAFLIKAEQGKAEAHHEH